MGSPPRDCRSPLTLISPGTDTETLPLRTRDLFEEISIAYVGTAYIGRTFGAFLDAMASLRRDRPEAAARLKLRIAGQVDGAQLQQLHAELTRRGLGDMVHLCDAASHDETLAEVRRSHLALVVPEGAPTSVPATLRECVGLGVPTLVLSEPTSAANREARRIGGIVIEPDDSVGLRHLLDDLVDGRVPVTMTPPTPLAYHSLA